MSHDPFEYTKTQLEAINQRLGEAEKVVEIVPAFTVRAYYSKYGEVNWQEFNPPIIWSEGPNPLPIDTLLHDIQHFDLVLTNKRLLTFNFQIYYFYSTPPPVQNLKKSSNLKQLWQDTKDAYNNANGIDKNQITMFWKSDVIVAESEMAEVITSKSLNIIPRVPDGALTQSGLLFSENEARTLDHIEALAALTSRRTGYTFWELVISRDDRSVLAPIYTPCSRVEKLCVEIQIGNTGKDAVQPPAAKQETDLIDALTKLQALRDKGAINDAEFEAMKEKVIGKLL